MVDARRGSEEIMTQFRAQFEKLQELHGYMMLALHRMGFLMSLNFCESCFVILLQQNKRDSQ